jgi:S1-C subfamily serine protease
MAVSADPPLQPVPVQSLKIYAVELVHFPKGDWAGNGVYLGNGRVLTAAHVVGSFWQIERVQIAGQALPMSVVKRGSFGGVDLALLSIDDAKLPVSLRLRRLTLCQGEPRPGEPVTVATPQSVASSRVIAPALLPRNLAPKYFTAISDVATTGNSGSGVFDSFKECLLGIISGKISGEQVSHLSVSLKPVKRDIAKFFVPASKISAFLPPQVAAAIQSR